MGIRIYEDVDTYKNIVTVKRRVSSDNIWTDVDVKVTPILCPRCQTCLPNLYEHLGSRYGQVGSVYCESCNTTLCITDHDNIVNQIHISADDYRNAWTLNLEKFDQIMDTITLEYKDLYLINIDIFQLLENKHNYSMPYGKRFDFSNVIEDICRTLKINDSHIPNKDLFVIEKID